MFLSLHKFIPCLVSSFTLYGGGGGGGGDGGAAERKAAEDRRIAAAIAQVNKIFGADSDNSEAKAEREKLYGKVATDFTNNAMVDLNKERDITGRDLNFQLARQGLSGGSRDVDANAEVTDRFNQGVLRANNLGIQAANNARSADTGTRQKIVTSIQAGLTADQAAQQAYEGMSNNAKAAADEASTASLAGFFDALRATQQQQAYNAGYGSTTPATPSYRTNPYFNTGSSYSGSSGKY